LTVSGVRPSGKGRPTPKRRDAQARRKFVEAPPANRKEAVKRLRERQREERGKTREGIQRGDDAFLPPRDRGPERALVRDLVDARRNIGTWFLLGALIVILGSGKSMPAEVRLAANIFWLLLILALVLDCLLIARVVRRAVNRKFPDTTQGMRSLYFYAILRSSVFRRMRTPKPRVRTGEPIH
jgi:hypothetical protein